MLQADSPQQLLANPTSAFSALVDSLGKVSETSEGENGERFVQARSRLVAGC
jgi:hypothetical protein